MSERGTGFLQFLNQDLDMLPLGFFFILGRVFITWGKFCFACQTLVFEFAVVADVEKVLFKFGADLDSIVSGHGTFFEVESYRTLSQKKQENLDPFTFLLHVKQFSGSFPFRSRCLLCLIVKIS